METVVTRKYFTIVTVGTKENVFCLLLTNKFLEKSIIKKRLKNLTSVDHRNHWDMKIDSYGHLKNN